jgi:hypothetical protein
VNGRRFRYQQPDGSWLKDVIVDLDEQGEPNWFEQFPGEARWYPHQPSAREREQVAEWRRRARATVEPVGV